MKKQTSSTIKAHLLRGAFYLLLFLGVCAIAFALAQPGSIVTEIPTASGLPPSRLEASSKVSHPASAGLTFADRVAYQSAIEDVYWRHRIWPDTNAGPKPPLDKMMSQAQIEKKVQEYLRNSQTLEDYWKRPLSADQLQTEMERMASHTKQPEVLGELFEALGNDPFVIAECLARPVLTERLIADLSAQHQTGRFESLRTAELRTVSTATMLGQIAYTLPEIASPSSGCTDDTWTPTTLTNAPEARDNDTAVWTGSEMIVWGGSAGTSAYFNSGGKYNPSTDSWTATSTTNAPEARHLHKAVWTGSEMVVWGGAASGPTFLNTGGRYNPGTDSWTATSTTNAPEARQFHSAVWSGSEMIVWGGQSNAPLVLNTGGRYNPSTDSWTATSSTNVPAARVSQAVVWTGSEMIVWGGMDLFNNSLNTGGRYNPSTDSWTSTSLTNAPAARRLHTKVWTGSEMIVWGGYDGISYLNSGGRYNPATDTWTATSTVNAPTARNAPAAVWTGSEMILWSGGVTLNTGGRYNPATNTWRATSTTSAPTARAQHTAVWTDSEMIVWGGLTTGPTYLNTGGRYCAAAPTPAAPTALKATNVTATSFTANWSSVSGAIGYRLDVSTNSSFVTYVAGYQNLDVGNTTSRNVTGLTANTSYYYRVRVYNGNGTSPNSNVITVKTKPH